MKKILFCNIPMTTNVSKCIYKSDDQSIPTSQTPVCYPVSAFLEKTLSNQDEIKAILLVKKDVLKQYKKNLTICMDELMAVSNTTGAQIVCKIIETEFSETQATHDNLLLSIVDEMEENTHVIADITYGPKDLPIVLFTAMNFAEKFLNCEIDNIVYGQATFVDGNAVNTKICDMIPLYYLNSVANTVQCSSPDKAKQLLKSLLSM